MSEGKLLSRTEVAKRIAEVERVASQIKWENNDCLPRAVAFTHGYPRDAHELGLHARAFVYQAIEASQTLADRNDEQVEIDKFVVSTRNQVEKKLKRNLNKADKSWVFIGNSDDSHAFGVLRIDEDEFVVANINSHEPYLTGNSNQIADRIMKYSKYTELAVYTIGFRNK